MKGHIRRLGGQWLRRPTAPDLAVMLLIVSYTLYFSAYTLARHQAFLTLGFDLGNVDQALWSTTQGRILRFTNKEGMTMRFGTHFEPILLFVSLTYFIYSGPETLLVLQSVVLALGAWPIYRLTGRWLKSNWMGVLFALVYLLSPGLVAANAYDFHAVTLAPTFLAWALWSLEEERYGRFIVWALLAMSCKEEMPLVIAMMGLWLLVRARRRLGVATLVIGVTWTTLAFLVVIPSFNTFAASPLIARYAHLGESPKEMLVNLVMRPTLYASILTKAQKIGYLVRLLFPTGYLALLAPHVLLFAAPSFAMNMLSSWPGMTALERFHYSAPIVPFVIIASAHGLSLVVRGMGRIFRHVDRRFLLGVWGGYVLLMTFFCHRANSLTPLGQYFVWPHVGEHERIGHRLVEQIPTDAAVSAHNQLNPHLSQRNKVYVFPRIEDAEYVLVDTVDDVTQLLYSEPVEDLQIAVQDLLADPNFGVAEAADGYILFQRGVGRKNLPDAFYTPFQLPDGTVHHTGQATFGTGLVLTNLTWYLERGTKLIIETVWLRQTEKIADGQIIVKLIESPTDWRVEEEQELTLSRWYPPQAWPKGQPVCDTLPYVLPSDVSANALHIGLVFRSPGGERLPVTLTNSGDWRLDESGTMLLVPLGSANN